MSSLWQSTSHEQETSTWSQKRPPDSSLTAHQVDVMDIADAIYSPPTTIDATYAQRCVHAAQLMGVSVTIPAQQQDVSAGSKPVSPPPDWSFLYPDGNPTAPWSSMAQGSDSSGQVANKNLAFSARNQVFEVMNQVSSLVARASNAGFAPPENPFSAIASLNAARNNQQPISVTAARADQLMSEVQGYLDLLKAESEGQLNIDSNSQSAAQLSSVSLSFDGFGGSGQSSVDLMKFLPDMDALSEQKAKDILAVLDFRKRVPKMVFTADYSPHGSPQGSVVGWRKMPDAAGYILKRRSMFDGATTQFTLTNAQLDTQHAQLLDYVNTWVLSFYDTIDPSSVYFYLDSTVSPDSYYIYTMNGFQLQDDGKTTVFTVDVSPANLSTTQRDQVKTTLASLGSGSNLDSPYPALAQVLLGNSSYDWILAGVNVRAAITRNETRTTTRNFSYLTADLQFLYSQMDAGKFVIPKGGSVKSVIDSVTSKVTSFGVSQVMYELMQETGILYYFEGVDAGKDPAFSNLGDQTLGSSDLLSVLVASIDPETLIMDLRALATNMPSLLAGGLTKAGTVIKPGSAGISQATEIVVPDIDAGNDTQFLSSLGDLDNEHADLTTFDGLSKFIRVIRIFSDYGRNRDVPPTPPTKATTVAASHGGAASPKTKPGTPNTTDQQKQAAAAAARQGVVGNQKNVGNKPPNGKGEGE